MQYLKIKNYHKYQHYSNRSILWIKLYINLLTDYKILQLTPFERWIFVGLLLVAGKNKNKIPFEINFIKISLTIPDTQEKELELAINKLLDLELLASTVLATCLPRREEKRKEENRKEKIATDVASVKKDLEIISLYSSSKGIKFENTGQYSSFIKRNIRAARLLTAYSLDKIKGVMVYLNKKADYKWTLETVGKFIDEDPNKLLTQNKPKII